MKICQINSTLNFKSNQNKQGVDTKVKKLWKDLHYTDNDERISFYEKQKRDMPKIIGATLIACALGVFAKGQYNKAKGITEPLIDTLDKGCELGFITYITGQAISIFKANKEIKAERENKQ